MELLIGVHDPEGRMADYVTHLQPSLRLFEPTFVCISPSTAIDTARRIEGLGLEIIPGSSQPHETKLALLRRSKSAVFSTELDKILHLQRFFPDELEAISRIRANGFILLGRSERAFQTFPRSWQENERVANEEMARLLGIPGIDICVGDFIAERSVVDLLKDKPALPHWECLVEMPADVVLAGYPLSYVALDGLEWEDPDRYQAEIQKEGYEVWKEKKYDSAGEWDKRRQELDGYKEAIKRFRNKLALPRYFNQPGVDSNG